MRKKLFDLKKNHAYIFPMSEILGLGLEGRYSIFMARFVPLNRLMQWLMRPGNRLSHFTTIYTLSVIYI